MRPPSRPEPAGLAATVIRGGAPVAAGGRLQRFRLDQPGWQRLEAALAADPLPLLGLWADRDAVHALFLESRMQALVASVSVDRQRYHALSAVRPVAALGERMVRDLWGWEAMGAVDLRPWLDHGAWGRTAPLAPRPGPAAYPAEPIEFLPLPPGRHGGGQRVDGPVQSGAGSPWLAAPWLLATASVRGRVLQAEPRLGCAHRGLDALLRGRPVGSAVRLAARTDAAAPVAHALALSRAIEDAAGAAEAGSPELAYRRRTLLELERVAGHLDALGRLAALIGLPGLSGEIGAALEAVRACCADGWDHRLLFDTISPGDAAPAMPGLVARAEGWRGSWAKLARLTDAAMATALRGLAVLSPAVARRHGVLGVAGRASGQGFDARLWGQRQPESGLVSGDALARARLRWTEIGAALDLLCGDPAASGTQSVLPLKPAFAAVSGEGIGVAEGPVGPIWCWVRLEAGLIDASWCIDPSLALWSALPDILAGTDPDRIRPAIASLAPTIPGPDR